MVTHFCPFDFYTLIAPLERNRPRFSYFYNLGIDIPFRTVL